MTDNSRAAVASPRIVRGADVVCDRHRAVIVASRMWPDDYQFCPDCRRLATAAPHGEIPLLPHLDTSRCVAVHEAGHAVAYILLGSKSTTRRCGPATAFRTGWVGM